MTQAAGSAPIKAPQLEKIQPQTEAHRLENVTSGLFSDTEHGIQEGGSFRGK